MLETGKGARWSAAGEVEVMGVPGPRAVYDRIEALAAPALESVIRTEEFARVTALVTGANRAARKRVNRVAARAWHTLNLPAGTDVQRLRQQVGSLDRDLRLMSLELQRERKEATRRAESRLERD